MNEIKHKKWNHFSIMIILLVLHYADQVNTSEELNLFDNYNLQQAKQFRNDIVDYINKAQILLKQVDEMVMNQIVNITESDQLNEETYNSYIDQVKQFETNLTNIASEYEKYNSGDDIYDIKTRATALKDELNQLKSNLDENTLKSLIYLNHYYGNETIMSRYENLTNFANELIENIFEKEQIVRELNCINAIKMYHFVTAEKHLKEISEDKRIINIVNKTYSGVLNNYYLLIKFGEHISNLTRSYLIFNELNKQMHENHDTSINKIYTLIKSLTTKIVDHKVYDEELGSKCLDMIDTLKVDLKTFGLKKITDILEENHIIYSDIKDLSKIFSLDRKIALDMFNESYQFCNDKKNFLKKFQDISQILLKENLQDSEALFNYILFIKEFFNEVDQKQFVDECLKIIKDSSNASNIIKSILFAEKVCIYNEQQIMSANKLDSSDYSITWFQSKFLENEEFWVLNNKYDNVYEIGNYHINNYTINLVNESGHQVSLEMKDEGKSNLWALEPSEDYVYIKNLNNNEYLYKKSQDIFTGEFDNTLEYQWKIKDCSDCSEYDRSDPSNGCLKSLTWIAVTQPNNHQIPSNAVQAGSDSYYKNSYVGRTTHSGYILPAKVVPNDGWAYVSFGGKVLYATSFEVLSSTQVEWKPSNGGAVPPEAVKVGKTPSGQPIYMGRARVGSYLRPGKIDTDCGCLLVANGWSEVKAYSYEVLVHKLT